MHAPPVFPTFGAPKTQILTVFPEESLEEEDPSTPLLLPLLLLLLLLETPPSTSWWLGPLVWVKVFSKNNNK